MLPLQNKFAKAMLGLTILALLLSCDNNPGVVTEDDHRWQGSRNQLRGSVFFRERIALPDTAELEVQILDISSPDAPVTLTTTGLMKTQGAPPYDFSIDIRAAEISRWKVRKKGYALRATIHVDGKLMFASPDYVDAAGGEDKRILVVRVTDDNTEQGMSLGGIHWGLQSLGKEQVQTGVDDRQLDIRFLVEESRAAGFSGCNRFSGAYESNAGIDTSGELSLGPIVGTRMACPRGQGDIEIPFLQMLNLVTAFKLEGGTLTLLAGEEALATFKPL